MIPPKRSLMFRNCQVCVLDGICCGVCGVASQIPFDILIEFDLPMFMC
jgi:hypothetical protein